MSANYFIQIWLILKDWVRNIKVEAWKIICSFIAMILFLIFFVVTNKVHEDKIELTCNRIYGIAEDSVKLELNLNRGIFDYSSEKVYNYARLKSHIRTDEVNDIDLTLFSEKELSQLEGVSLKNIKCIYDFNIVHTIPWYIRILWLEKNARKINKQMGQGQFKMPISKEIYTKDGYRYNEFGRKMIFTSPNVSYVHKFRTNHIAKYRSFFSPYDISQEYISLNINTNVNYTELSINCYGPAEFSAMIPIPDFIYMDKIVFNDQKKISQIKGEGLRFFVNYAQLENLQSMRAFMITTFLSLFITLFCSLLFKYIKSKIQLKIKKESKL